MNYRKVYIDIINKAKKDNRSKKNGYYEKHHILLKSIYPLWAKNKSNIVLLTTREHFFCHLLLLKIYRNDPMKYKKMAYALFKFQINPHHDYKISSREYEIIRKNLAIATSINFKGKKQRKEWIEKRVAAMIKTKEKNPQKWTESQRKFMIKWFEDNKEFLSKRKKEGWTKEVKENFSKSRKEWFEKQKEKDSDFWSKKQKSLFSSPELREKLSTSKKGKVLYVNKETGEKHYYINGEQPNEYIVVSKKHISRLSIEEVRNKYLNYKLNGGELNWNDFQKKIKEDTIDI